MSTSTQDEKKPKKKRKTTTKKAKVKTDNPIKPAKYNFIFTKVHLAGCADSITSNKYAAKDIIWPIAPPYSLPITNPTIHATDFKCSLL